MEKITIEKLKSLMESQYMIITIDVGGEEAEISPNMYLDFSDDDVSMPSQITYQGYIVDLGEKTRKCKNFDTMLAYLKKIKAIENGELTAIKFNDMFDTLAEIEENNAFMALSDEEIIDKYRPIADEFELVAPFATDYIDKFPYTKAKLSEQDGLKII